MKRSVLLTLIALFCVSFSISAEEAVLIDFSTLAADYALGDAEEPNENEATLVDFGDKAGTGFTEEEKMLMKTSLALDNWDVDLASSSSTVMNMTLSIAKEVPVRDDAKRFAGEKVLGVRVHFPTEPFHSWAIVQPPFEIPMYMQKTIVQQDGTMVPDEEDASGSKFDGYGVLKNVGVIKSLSVNVLGLNFPQGMEVVLKDQNNKTRSLFMGNLHFDGWRTLTWTNPNYIEDVRDREMRRYPLYPKATPSYNLQGIRFLRDKSQEGGDFITYIKDITMVYDKAVLTLDTDVNNEAVWGILQEREEARRNAEFRRLGEIQVLRHLERQKMHQEEEALEGTAEETTTE